VFRTHANAFTLLIYVCRCVQLELDKELVENKYTQQRKRLTLAKRENDELRTTLDAAIAEIGKLGEEAQVEL